MAKKSKSNVLCHIIIYGQECNSTTRREAIMNLALRGIRADFGPEHADTFRRDLSNPFLTPTYLLNFV
jgi:type I restriction enzyme M protein